MKQKVHMRHLRAIRHLKGLICIGGDEKPIEIEVAETVGSK
jgi:hypothetical protein